MEERTTSGFELPIDLWRCIGLKLDTPADRLRFRAVCKSWNSALPFRRPPCLLLAESPLPKTDQGGAPPPRGFLCLGDDKTYTLHLPEIHRAKCVGSTGNSLVTLHPDESIRVFDPFSKLQFHLPSLPSLVHKIILSRGDAQACVAVALHNEFRVLEFARPGDASWTTLPVVTDEVEDMIFHKGCLYAISYQTRLILCDYERVPPSVCYLTDALTTLIRNQKMYLVELSGELLLVIKFMDYFPDEQPHFIVNRFEVYKLDSGAMKFNRFKDLGDHSLFLGLNTSVAVPASDYFGFVKPNCIYFTDDYARGIDKLDHAMGVFDMGDNSITPHYKGLLTSLYSPPLWIVPPS